MRSFRQGGQGPGARYAPAVVNVVALSRSPESNARGEVIRSELLALISRLSQHEGTSRVGQSSVHVHRSVRPSPLERWQTPGPHLVLVVQGAKTSLYQGRELVYNPTHYLLVTGEAVFEGAVTEASPEQPFLALCCPLPADVIARTALALADAGAAVASAPIALVAPVEAPIAECMLRILRASEDPVDRALVTPLVMEELIYRLLRSEVAGALQSVLRPAGDADKIQLAMRYLRAHLDRPVAVEEVARHVAMSPSHFAHRFRAVARVSPMQYLKQQRLHHARTLLLADGLRVSEAAVRAGYESTSHFTREFKSAFGVAPGEFTRRFRQG